MNKTNVQLIQGARHRNGGQLAERLIDRVDQWRSCFSFGVILAFLPRRFAEDASHTCPGKRLYDLAEKAFVDDAADADIGRGRARGIVVGAEDLIPDDDVLAIVGVALAQVTRMMPAVDARRGEDPIEHARAHIDIAMGQKADEHRCRAEPQEHREWRTEQIQRQLAEQHLYERIDEVEASGVEHPESLDAVMQGMEAPKQQSFVAQAMREVEPELGDHQAKDSLHEHRRFGWPKGIGVLQRWLGKCREQHRK